MNIQKLYMLVAGLFMLALFSSCQDYLEYDGADIPEGYSEVQLQVGYDTFTPALTRSSGKALSDIQTLWVAAYKTDGTHVLTQEISAKDHGLTMTQNPGDALNQATAEAKFNLVLPNGRYRIYAIANLDLAERMEKMPDDHKYFSEEELKQLRVYWDSEDISKNGQMYGYFNNYGENPAYPTTASLDAVPVTVGNGSTKLHAWLRRCASKVTVAYDGTELNEGVSIYLMGVSIKDIPRSCAIGEDNSSANNHVNHADSLIHEGELVTYFQGDVKPGEAGFITEYKAKLTRGVKYGSDHADDAEESLFFFENMQGAGDSMPDKRQDADGNGVIDNPGEVDKRVPNGTYIEVEAIYRKENKETVNGVTTVKPESGIIKYRFMLGKDVIKDYNAQRNHHYKLTLKFYGNPDEMDWNIEYKKQVLEVTDPDIYDYRGMILDPNDNLPNRGHVFTEENSVRLTSYVEEEQDKLAPYKVLYPKTANENETEFVEQKPEWLSWLSYEEKDGRFPYEKDLVFKADPVEAKTIDINDNLSKAAQKGSAAAPFDLSDPDGKGRTTANCYIVDAPGYYTFPLVYGCAIQGGATVDKSYKPGGTGKTLATFKNHLNNDITSPWIRDNAGVAPVQAALLWQDELLINYATESSKQIKYNPTAYNGKGGISFYIDRSDIKQGNMVIALLDGAFDQTTMWKNTANRPKVIWSWHIWVTNTNGIAPEDETICVTGNDQQSSYDFMPMNLGWCADNNEPLRYYQGRKAKLKIIAGTEEKSIEIEQKSHISFSCGNNSYYQWGRKDPFKGSISTAPNNHKHTYTVPNQNPSALENPSWAYWTDNDAPYALTGSFNKDEWEDAEDYMQNTKNKLRQKTTDNGLLAKLICDPCAWHNPPANTPNIYGKYSDPKFRSINEVFTNLWGNQASGHPVKTIYDPCPPGYQVPHYFAFTGFTTTGKDTNYEHEWMNAIEGNILDAKTDKAAYYDGVYEFYTNRDKNQSIVFPLSGYRDWDDEAAPYQVRDIGFCWTVVSSSPAGNSFISLHDTDWIINFKYSRYDPTASTEEGRAYIHPQSGMFATDGFSIRPVKQK